jgi:NAD(P)-dependent dehydrogenase (short-subunit alcohol dehydrogenase family)
VDYNPNKVYNPKTQILSERVILVTGASKGIGRAVALEAAKHGATVIILGKEVKALETLYDEIEAAGGPQAAIYPLNLANATPSDYETLAEQLEKRYGRLDGLLHNAATFNTLTPLEHYSLPVWYQVMQVNLNAPFLLTQATLGLLKKSKDARLLFTGASEDQLGKAYWGAYAVSKQGCEGLMHVLAEECEVNTAIRVNLLHPGKVATNLRTKAYPGNPQGNAAYPSAEHMAQYYIYWLGPDSRSVHGKCISLQT